MGAAGHGRLGKAAHRRNPNPINPRRPTAAAGTCASVAATLGIAAPPSASAGQADIGRVGRKEYGKIAVKILLFFHGPWGPRIEATANAAANAAPTRHRLGRRPDRAGRQVFQGTVAPPACQADKDLGTASKRHPAPDIRPPARRWRSWRPTPCPPPRCATRPAPAWSPRSAAAPFPWRSCCGR